MALYGPAHTVGSKYTPTKGTSGDKTGAQQVLAVKSDKMAKLSAFGQDTMVLPETRPDGTDGDLWNFSLCVWEDANLTNLLASIKAICYNITERFANQEAESIKGDLVRIAMASMPGYFKRFSVDEAYVRKYEAGQSGNKQNTNTIATCPIMLLMQERFTASTLTKRSSLTF